MALKKKSLPDMDGTPEIGKTYFTINSRIDPRTIQSKENIIKAFQTRYERNPNEVFYGPPGGSLLYAGPTEIE